MQNPRIILLALIIGIFFGVAGYCFVYAKGYSYMLDNPAACANCHAMRVQHDAWMKSTHHAAATCNDCHTPHNLLGKYAVKASNGFFHSFYFTTGRYPDNIQITKLDLRITEAACRRCHQSIVQNIDLGGAHGKVNEIQCTRCHSSVGHSDQSARLRMPRLFGGWNDFSK